MAGGVRNFAGSCVEIYALPQYATRSACGSVPKARCKL